MSLDECQIIELPKLHDPRGNLTFVESRRHVPFDLKRVCYLYDVPRGESRAGHAQRSCHQVIIAISGSSDVILGDGFIKRSFTLNRSNYGLYVTPMVWTEIENLWSTSICMVLASEFYSPADYYYSYEEYKIAIQRKCSSPTFQVSP
jgi:hypothetical protein